MIELLRKSFSDYLKILKNIPKNLLETLKYEAKYGDDLDKLGLYLIIFLGIPLTPLMLFFGLKLLLNAPFTMIFIILMLLLPGYIITALNNLED